MFGKTAGARNPLVDQMIRTAVERELASKGLTKVETDADLKVVYLAASGFNLEVAKVPFFTPVNPVYTGIMPGAAAMWDVTTGTLLIDLFDIKTDRVVFRGTIRKCWNASQQRSGATPSSVRSQLQRNAKIF